MGCASSKHQDQADLRQQRSKGGKPGPPGQRRGAAKGGQEAVTGVSGPVKKAGSKADLPQAGGGGHRHVPSGGRKAEVRGSQARLGDGKPQAPAQAQAPSQQSGMPRGKPGEARKKVHDSDEGPRGAGVRAARKGPTDLRAEADGQEGEERAAGEVGERERAGAPRIPGAASVSGPKGRVRREDEGAASDSETARRHKSRHDGPDGDEGARRRGGVGGQEDPKGKPTKGVLGMGFSMGSGLAASLGLGLSTRAGKAVPEASRPGGVQVAYSAGWKVPGKTPRMLRTASLKERARRGEGDAEGGAQAGAQGADVFAAGASGGEAQDKGGSEAAAQAAARRKGRAVSGSLLGPGMKKKHRQAREEREKEERKERERDGDRDSERYKDRDSRLSPLGARTGPVRSISTTNSSSSGGGGGAGGGGSLGLSSSGKVGMAPFVLGHPLSGSKEKPLRASGRDDGKGKELLAKDPDSAWLYEPLIRCSTFLGTQGKIEVMGFEVANTVVRSIRLRQQLQQRDLEALRKDVIQSEGIQTLVSSDVDYVWALAGSDKREELRAIARDVVRMGRMATKPELHHLAAKLNSLGKDKDRHWKNVAAEQADKVFKRLESRARATADLYHEISSLENMQKALSKRLKEPKSAIQEIVGQMKTELKNQEKKVQEKRAEGLWDQSMDRVVPDLFVVAVVLHFRIVEAFGEGVLDDGPLVRQTLEDTIYAGENDTSPWPSTPGTTTPRQFPLSPVANIPGAAASAAATALAFPSSSSAPSFPTSSLLAGCSGLNQSANHAGNQTSLSYGSLSFGHIPQGSSGSATSGGAASLGAPYTRSQSAGGATSVLGAASAPATSTPGAGGGAWPKSRSVTAGATPDKELTLGDTGMSLHYANIVAMVDKMVLRVNMFQHRDALYTALPRAVKQRLKKDLQSSSNLELVTTEEIKQRLAQRLDWLATMAENTIKVGVDKRLQGHTDLTLLETLHHAKEGRMQALLTELLVNLQHLVARSMMQQEEDDDDDFDFGDDELLLLSLQQQEQKQPPADWKPVPQFAIVAPMPDIDQPSRASSAAGLPSSLAASDAPTAFPLPTDAPSPATSSPHSSAPRPSSASSPAADPGLASAPRASSFRGTGLFQSLSRSTSGGNSGPLASGVPEAAPGEASAAGAGSGAMQGLGAALGAAAGPGPVGEGGVSGVTEGEAVILLPMEKAASFPLGQSDMGSAGVGAGADGGTPGSGRVPNVAKRILYASSSSSVPQGSPSCLPLVPEDGDVFQGSGWAQGVPASAPVGLGPLGVQQQMQQRRMHARERAGRSGPLRPREAMWLQGSGPVGGGGGDRRGETFAFEGMGGGVSVSALRGVHSLDFPRTNTMEAGGSHSRGGSMSFTDADEEGGEGLRGAQRRMMMSGGGFAAWSEVSAEIREGFEERIRDSALSRRPSRLRTLSRAVKQMSSRQMDLDSGGLTVSTSSGTARGGTPQSRATGAEPGSSAGGRGGQSGEGVGEARSGDESEGTEGAGPGGERRGHHGLEALASSRSGDMFQDNNDDSLDIPAMTPRSLDVDRIGDEYFDELGHGSQPIFRVASE